MKIEKRIEELGLTLPKTTEPMANYVKAVRTGNLLYTSGHGPYDDGVVKRTGKLGRELTVDEGYQVARNIALNLVATVKAAVNDLDEVKKIVKLLGMVNCTEDFGDSPKVINGCSDLLVEIFGEEVGKHARSAVGMQELPGHMPVEIEMILEIK